MLSFKRYIMYLLFFIGIIFIIPALCTKKAEKTVADVQDENINKKNSEILEKPPQYEYSQFATIKLLHKNDNNVEELPIDEYLYGVVSAEMPVSFEIEALKAQAVAARTYTIYKILHSSGKHENADICDDSTCCQAWISKEKRFEKWAEEERESNWNKIVEAVNSTVGKVITFNGEPINAFFHSNSGGITETVSNVWGGNDLPYLKSVETSGEDSYSEYNSEVIISKQEVFDKLKQEFPDIIINFEEDECIKILDYTESKRVKTVKFGNIEIPGTKVRSIFGLKSTNFTITFDENNVIFSVVGYGHGVGLSQTGADSLAKAGNSYEEIIKHFYTGVEISEWRN